MTNIYQTFKMNKNLYLLLGVFILCFSAAEGISEYLLKIKGGLSSSQQKDAIAESSVFIAPKLLQQLTKEFGSDAERWDQIGVCRGPIPKVTISGINRTSLQKYRLFACPLEVPDNWKRGDGFCCGPIDSETCCSREKFVEMYKPKPNIILIIIGAIAGVIVLIGLAWYIYHRIRAYRLGRMIETMQPGSMSPGEPMNKLSLVGGTATSAPSSHYQRPSNSSKSPGRVDYNDDHLDHIVLSDYSSPCHHDSAPAYTSCSACDD